MARAHGASRPVSGFKQWSRSRQTMSSSSLRTKPRPTPAVEAAASLYVLHVRGSVLDAAMPADVSGTFFASRRIHLSRVVSSTGSGLRAAARESALRHRGEHVLAWERAMIG